MSLRQLADDVRERFARLRVRHHASGQNSTKSAGKRQSKVLAQLPRQGTSDDRPSCGDSDRTETPDLIRPHVDPAIRTASLPPLPPTPPSSANRPRGRRRTSAYLCPSTSTAVLGHIYEEIPSPPPPDLQQRRNSSYACVEFGRIYYVSPLDGALCRIFPVDDRAVHHRQLACTHVRRRPSSTAVSDSRPPSPPIDIASVVASDLSEVRGRELRLCTSCYRHLRSGLAIDETTSGDCLQRRPDGTVSPSSSFYNSCDLSLLTVPCCYSSEAGDVDDDDDNVTSHDVMTPRDGDTVTTNQDATQRDMVHNDVKEDISADGTSGTGNAPPPPKFGETGSAFTTVGGGRSPADDGPATSASSAFSHDSRRESQRRQRPCRVVTDPSFDVRRRPLRTADESLLAVLDSVPDNDFRSSYLRLCSDSCGSRCDVIDQRPDSCMKSTSCADVRSPRRRSLALRRRSDDDGRRRRFCPAALPPSTSSRWAIGGSRRVSACCSGSELSLGHRGSVKSVYYNGLLASMIDLTAAFDRASADDRLSCRATSGPRRSLRPTRLSPGSSGRGQHDRFTATIHHSSGDLMLRSVQ